MSEALFDCRDHEVAHIFSLDAFGRGDMPHSLAIAAIERKGNANFFGIVAGDLEAIRAPAQVRSLDRDLAVMPAFRTSASMALEKKAVSAHHPINALAVAGARPSAMASQRRMAQTRA